MRNIVFVVMLLALVFAPGGVRAASKAEVRTAIQARYDQFDRAYMRKDFKSVGEVFTPGCVLKLKGENRSLLAPRAVQGMLTISKALTVTHAVTRIVSVAAQGDTFVVSAIWTGDSAYVPPLGTQDDRPRHGRTHQVYSDTWRKTKTDWQIVQRIIKG